MELSTLILIIVFVLSFVWPYIVCYYRYYSPFAPEKYKIQHQKWKEAMASVYYKRLNDLYTNASYFM